MSKLQIKGKQTKIMPSLGCSNLCGRVGVDLLIFKNANKMGSEKLIV